MTPAQQFTARLRRRWPIVVAVAVIGGTAAAGWSVMSAVTVWTGTTALTTQSQNRSPDQDAVLALGYVDYFNQDTYQQLLHVHAAIPAGITLTAKTGATSPVFYVEARGTDKEQVRAAAAAAAETYRSDIRTSLVAERKQAADDLQAEVDENVRVLQGQGRTDAEKNVILDQIRSLQGRLTELEADSTNHIKQLQPIPGMASSTPSPAVNIAAGVVGGAVLGVLLVVLLMVTDSRLRTRQDLTQRLGLRTFADLGGRGDATARALRMANLANALDLVGATGRATTVAIVSARRSVRSSDLARELAATVAQRRTESMLLLADVRGVPDPALAGRTGLVDVLAGRAGLQETALRDATGYLVLPAGNGPLGESFTAFPPARLTELVAEAGASNRVVVIDAPPLLEAAESQLVCAAADTVIIVVERGRTRLRDVREAMALLADVRVEVSGAVIDRPGDGRAAPATVLDPVAETGGSNGSSGSTAGAQQLVGPGSRTESR